MEILQRRHFSKIRELQQAAEPAGGDERREDAWSAEGERAPEGRDQERQERAEPQLDNDA